MALLYGNGMKFVRTTKTDLTWLFYQGTEDELDRAKVLIDKLKTAYVIAGKRELFFDFPKEEGQRTQAILQVIRARMSNMEIYQQGFGFKSNSDALRFKLSL